MAGVLTPRRGRILKHVVEEYVVSAQPVSSEALVRKYVPNVSGATMRNELAALEGFGFLHQPHTSAGRIPSDRGYRYYVEWLMGGARVAESEERMIAHQFHQVESDVGEWLRLAASVVASHMQNPVFVAPLSESASCLRRVDLVRIGFATVLVVAILRSGAVRMTLARLSEDLGSEELGRLANEWSDRFTDRSASEIRLLTDDAPNPALLQSVVRMLEETDRQTAAGDSEVVLEGLSYMAAQPEFGTSDRLQPVVEVLEHHGLLHALMDAVPPREGTRVAIGVEHGLDALRECSAVLATYGRPGELTGVVGVIGPTRLAYWRAVPMVEYVAQVLDRLLIETFLA